MWKTAIGILLLGFCIISMVFAAMLAKEGKGTPVGIWISYWLLFYDRRKVVFSPLGNAFV